MFSICLCSYSSPREVECLDVMITVVYQLCTLLMSSKSAVRRQERTGFNTTVEKKRAEESVLQKTSETFDIKKDCLAVNFRLVVQKAVLNVYQSQGTYNLEMLCV